MQADDGSFVVSCVDRYIDVLSVGVSILLMERWLREEKRRKEEEVRIEKNFGSLKPLAARDVHNAIANSVETVALDLLPFKTPCLHLVSKNVTNSGDSKTHLSLEWLPLDICEREVANRNLR